MLYFISFLLFFSWATSAMELPIDGVIVPQEEAIIESFKCYVKMGNVTEVERYLKDIITPVMLERCLDDNDIDVNRLLGTGDKCDRWRQIALRAENSQNFKVIASRLNRFAIQHALDEAIIANKPEYVEVCLSSSRLIKPLNIDHKTDYGKNIIQKISDDSTGQIAQLLIPHLKPHFSYALSSSYFDLIVTKGPNEMYKKLILDCWQQAKKENFLEHNLNNLLKKMFEEYISIKEQLLANKTAKIITQKVFFEKTQTNFYSDPSDSGEWEDL